MTINDDLAPASGPDPMLRRILTRRQLMMGAFGSAAAAAVLAACGSSAKTADAPAATDAAAPGATEPAAAPATEAETAATEAETASTEAETAATEAVVPSAGGTNSAKFGGGGGDGTLKIGFTAPLTGPLAGFGEANDFILAGVNELIKDGIMLGDKSYKIEIIVKDTESSSDTAASRAGELIIDDEVDMMLAIATPEMINPVADQSGR